MPYPRAYPMFYDEINFWMIPTLILNISNFFEVKILSDLNVKIHRS